MFPANPRLLRTALLAGGMVMAAPDGVYGLPALEIREAQHFHFLPEPGTAWYLDGSEDGLSWKAAAGPFFANGEPIDHVQRTDRAVKEYRLRPVDPATVGHAPVTVAGFSCVMENAGQPLEVVFMNEVRGFIRIDDKHARSFTYTWLKKSADEGEAILSGADGTFTLLRLQFKDGQLGRWGMEDIPSPQAAPLVVDTLDAGAFTFLKGRMRRDLKYAALPLDIAGGRLLLNEAGKLTHLEFSNAGAVEILTASGERVRGSYTYDPHDATRAGLRVELPNAPPFGLSLDLTAPGMGRFEEVLPPGAGARANQPPRSGTFTLPDDQPEPANPDCPPTDITGLSLVINDSSPCTLVFNGDGMGVQIKEVNGAVEITPFQYSYSRTGGNGASVAITFPGAAGDLIDDYVLDFKDDCTGSFQRNSFHDGTSSGSGEGTFGPGAPAGRFPGAPLPGLGI